MGGSCRRGWSRGRRTGVERVVRRSGIGSSRVAIAAAGEGTLVGALELGHPLAVVGQLAVHLVEPVIHLGAQALHLDPELVAPSPDAQAVYGLQAGDRHRQSSTARRGALERRPAPARRRGGTSGRLPNRLPGRVRRQCRACRGGIVLPHRPAQPASGPRGDRARSSSRRPARGPPPGPERGPAGGAPADRRRRALRSGWPPAPRRRRPESVACTPRSLPDSCSRESIPRTPSPAARAPPCRLPLATGPSPPVRSDSALPSATCR